MSVKSHFPWPLKIVSLVVMIGVAVALTFWVYESGRKSAGAHMSAAESTRTVSELKSQVVELSAERDRFSSVVNASESQSNIAQATQVQLSKQIATLEANNAKLKEDLAFFEGLLPTATGGDGIAIQRLSLQLMSPTQLRYRALIMQGGKVGRDFIGDVQIIVTLTVRGKSVVLSFPEQNTNTVEKAGFQLDFKYYQRVDGVLTLPDGAVVKTLQAKVRQRGRVLAQQTADI
ncbi:hypothetical protein QN379_02305 [Glaciimonas sp. Gout2]|uniref:DUF6776 family protein n=1 Tax=unclassified Glaciimonas TaxID=2644401 RepID=UPI002B229AD8|nr:MULTISPECIES: DUF6776 family protein [unclassified Glaciimonas]MEB0012864.1 hypothetical protein [Glaciimonas sp. Cout2]MEB0080845.1 hypothetical protein [Glaciimonas sp. Gout2]